jgi:cytochrome c oxidase subunit 3
MADRAAVAEPYVTRPQQREAAVMGMYVFLGSEIMLFGGLFVVALSLRLLHPQDVVAASRHLHLSIGALNTLVLLTSSFCVALAVQMAHAARIQSTAWLLVAGAALGLIFLGIKAVEYRTEYGEGLLPFFSQPARFQSTAAKLFMDLYLVSTALHAVHVTVGILLLAGVAVRVGRRRLALPRRAIVVETTGLYWHLVDAIWVFLYAVLYLAR